MMSQVPTSLTPTTPPSVSSTEFWQQQHRHRHNHPTDGDADSSSYTSTFPSTPPSLRGNGVGGARGVDKGDYATDPPLLTPTINAVGVDGGSASAKKKKLLQTAGSKLSTPRRSGRKAVTSIVRSMSVSSRNDKNTERSTASAHSLTSVPGVVLGGVAASAAADDDDGEDDMGPRGGNSAANEEKRVQESFGSLSELFEGAGPPHRLIPTTSSATDQNILISTNWRGAHPSPPSPPPTTSQSSDVLPNPFSSLEMDLDKIFATAAIDDGNGVGGKRGAGAGIGRRTKSTIFTGSAATTSVSGLLKKASSSVAAARAVAHRRNRSETSSDDAGCMGGWSGGGDGNGGGGAPHIVIPPGPPDITKAASDNLEPDIGYRLALPDKLDIMCGRATPPPSPTKMMSDRSTMGGSGHGGIGSGGGGRGSGIGSNNESRDDDQGNVTGFGGGGISLSSSRSRSPSKKLLIVPQDRSTPLSNLKRKLAKVPAPGALLHPNSGAGGGGGGNGSSRRFPTLGGASSAPTGTVATQPPYHHRKHQIRTPSSVRRHSATGDRDAATVIGGAEGMAMMMGTGDGKNEGEGEEEIILRSSELEPTVHQTKISPATDLLVCARVCSLMERYDMLLEEQARMGRRWFDFSDLVGVRREEVEAMYLKAIGKKGVGGGADGISGGVDSGRGMMLGRTMQLLPAPTPAMAMARGGAGNPFVEIAPLPPPPPPPPTVTPINPFDRFSDLTAAAEVPNPVPTSQPMIAAQDVVPDCSVGAAKEYSKPEIDEMEAALFGNASVIARGGGGGNGEPNFEAALFGGGDDGISVPPSFSDRGNPFGHDVGGGGGASPRSKVYAAAAEKKPDPSILKSLLECADDMIVEGYFTETCGGEDDVSSVGVMVGEKGSAAGSRVQATVLSSQSQRQFVICYRGDIRQQEKPTKAHMKLKEVDGEPSLFHPKHPVPVDRRYRDSYFAANSRLESRIFALLDELHAADPFCDVVYTGHSYGAALSLLGAVRCAALRPAVTVSCVGFGSPKVGGLDFRHFANSLPNLRVLRVEYGRDLYVNWPEGGKWYHAGHTIAIRSPDQMRDAAVSAAAAFGIAAEGGGGILRRNAAHSARDLLSNAAGKVTEAAGKATDAAISGKGIAGSAGGADGGGKGAAIAATAALKKKPATSSSAARVIPPAAVLAYKFDKRPASGGSGGVIPTAVSSAKGTVLDPSARGKKLQGKEDHEMRSYAYGLERFTHFGLPWVSTFVGEEGEGIVSYVDQESRHLV